MRELRRAEDADIPRLIDVFWRGVHEGAAPRYSERQRQAWLPARPEEGAFRTRLSDQTVFVMQVDQHIVGFMSVTANGYVDFAYVLPEYRGQGVADALLAMVENHAQVTGLGALSTRASDMARPFFLRHGWSVDRPAPQRRDGVTIPATDMVKPLATPRADAA